MPKSLDSRGPDWTRDELILALDFYLSHQPKLPGKATREIKGLSELLNRLGEKLFPPELRSSKFRNVNGVNMKLMNFRGLDPEYTAKGKKGLTGEGVRTRKFGRNLQATLSTVEKSHKRSSPAWKF